MPLKLSCSSTALLLGGSVLAAAATTDPVDFAAKREAIVAADKGDPAKLSADLQALAKETAYANGYGATYDRQRYLIAKYGIPRKGGMQTDWNKPFFFLDYGAWTTHWDAKGDKRTITFYLDKERFHGPLAVSPRVLIASKSIGDSDLEAIVEQGVPIGSRDARFLPITREKGDVFIATFTMSPGNRETHIVRIFADVEKDYLTRAAIDLGKNELGLPFVGGYYTAADVTTAPKPISKPLAKFPANWVPSKSQPVFVAVQFIVEKDGSVNECAMQATSAPTLVDAALNAVRSWKFTPATRDGKPVRCLLNQRVDFAPST